MSSARVRFGHCSSNTPRVDVWVDGRRLLTDVAYGTIDDYADLPAGTHSVAVTLAGKQRTDALCTADFDLEPGRAYTVLAVGEFDDIEVAGYEDARPDESIPAGASRVRFLHCAPAVRAVDVAVRDGPVLFEGVEFGDDTGYESVDAGSHDVELRRSDTDEVRLELLDATFPAGAACTLFAVGMGEELDLLPRRDGESASGTEGARRATAR